MRSPALMFGSGLCVAWSDTPIADSLEALIAEGDPSPPPKPGAEPKLVILTSGTTGTPERRTSFPAALAAAGRRPAEQGAVSRARSHRVLCTAVSRAGLRPSDARTALGFDTGGAPPLRRTTHRGQPRRASRHGDDRRADHAAPHHRPGLGVRDRARTSRRCASSSSPGRSWAAAVPRGDGRLRPGHLQHVRLDGGRLRHHRHAGRPCA